MTESAPPDNLCDCSKIKLPCILPALPYPLCLTCHPNTYAQLLQNPDKGKETPKEVSSKDSPAVSF